MDAAGIYANRNAVPDDPSSAFYPSGVRIGTPLATTRGMREPEMARIAEWICRAIDVVKDDRLPGDRRGRGQHIRALRQRLSSHPVLASIREEVRSLASTCPLFTW
jgi:glycine hydroxymethyltransferase